jgi:VanZ family protein
LSQTLSLSRKQTPRLRLRKVAAVSLTAVLAVTIAYLTLMPVSMPQSVPGSDKLHHLIAFAALTLPCAALWPRALLWLLPAAVLFGGAIEIIQPGIGRSGEWADFYADVAGVSLGMILGLSLNRLPMGRPRAPQPQASQD